MSKLLPPGTKVVLKNNDQYWSTTVETIMVPVVVSYHKPTDDVFSFVPPTRADVEKAVRNKPKYEP